MTGERVLRVLVPVHHDPGRRRWRRLDRRRAVVDCLESLVVAVGQWRTGGTGLAFDDVRILVVDDGSPTPLRALLPPGLLGAVEVLRLDTRRGQGAALNAALTRRPAAAYAITDSDCTVAPDWLTTIEKLADSGDGTDGTAGPPWRHRPVGGRKARWLTAAETDLVRHCTTSARTTRLDCRNVWLRDRLVDRVGRATFFPTDAGAALSGMTSRKLAAAGTRLGFDEGMAVQHEPLTSIRAQLVTYFSRGATSRLADHYATGHRSLRHAFLSTYARRHFLDPVRVGVSPAYVLLAHGAYWLGLTRRRLTRAQSR